MPKIPEKDLLILLKQGNSKAYTYLYDQCFPAISRYIRQNSGNMQDAGDIFQEAVLILLEKLRTSDFVLTASMSTYLFAIARNLWLKQLRENKYRLASAELPELPEEQEQESPYLHHLPGWLGKITSYCQQLLTAIFFKNTPINTLMHKMGWKNKHTAAQQRYKCLMQIKNISAKEILKWGD